MAKIILSNEATQDIENILASVYDFTGFISTPQKLFDEFKKTFELISLMPDAIGRLRPNGDREAFCRGYRIVYHKHGEDILIVTVIHSSRLYPRP